MKVNKIWIYSTCTKIQRHVFTRYYCFHSSVFLTLCVLRHTALYLCFISLLSIIIILIYKDSTTNIRFRFSWNSEVDSSEFHENKIPVFDENVMRHCVIKKRTIVDPMNIWWTPDESRRSCLSSMFFSLSITHLINVSHFYWLIIELFIDYIFERSIFFHLINVVNFVKRRLPCVKC